MNECIEYMGGKAKTTAKDFMFFESKVKKWAKIFGLRNWDIMCTHMEDSGNCASVKYNSEGRLAFVNLSIDYPKISYSRVEIEKSAFHEVIELLLVDLVDIAQRREYDESTLVREKHRIIHTLENIIFEKEK